MGLVHLAPVPFPVWYCKSCGRPAFAAPEQLPVNPPETPYTGACTCGCTEFLPETAVFDTWATSSLTPLINAQNGLPALPMTMRTQAHEIIRTWTFYTIVRSLYHTGKLPWKDLMICGFVLAKPGEKMGKSKGNALDPAALIQKHSADALRYWTAGAKLGTDIRFCTARRLRAGRRGAHFARRPLDARPVRGNGRKSRRPAPRLRAWPRAPGDRRAFLARLLRRLPRARQKPPV